MGSITEAQARECAKNCIRRFWNDGKQSVRQMEQGQGGHAGNDYWASIGGYLDGKRISPSRVVVTEVEDEKCGFSFSLRELYKELKQEARK